MSADGPRTAPYGAWSSPITADAVAGGSHPVGGARFVGDEVWWLELRPSEGGRNAIRRAGGEGTPEDVLPAPWNVRSRVHEYGGSAWTITGDGSLVFSEFTDQRLYRLTTTPGAEPTPITPEPSERASLRYAEPQPCPQDDEIWCLRERHDDGRVIREFVAVPLDGCAVDDPSRIRVIAGGSHFLAGLRISPDASTLAWIAWDHPQMPWDGTELRVATLNGDGVAEDVRTLIGSTTESVLQPEWHEDGSLFALSDRTGFWNLYRVPVDGADPVPVHPVEAEVGGPLWRLGTRWYAFGDPTRVVLVRSLGTDTLVEVDLGTGAARDIDLPGHTTITLDGVHHRDVLLVTGGARVPTGLRHYELDTGMLDDLRLAVDGGFDDRYFAQGRLRTFPGPRGRRVHAVVYPPTNPEYEAPRDELPPYVAWIHGGPTSRVAPEMSVAVAYFTSRGIGVVDVDYGGSTGFGREYRELLRGQWGIVDVEDTVAVVHGLADAGEADRARLAIRGGSAGGWTVLSALTTSDAFACGTSYFGVAELIEFAQETHDFESRYLDGLIGTLPEDREIYERRAPVNNVDGLSCPVLLLQGLDDPIVPPSQAERFRDALVAKGLPYALRMYEGESHGFRRRETIVDATEAELSFYGQVLGFAPPYVPVIELIRPRD